jgi:hypothetical protein
MFDIDDAGAPQLLETRCVVDAARAPAPKAWLDFAEQSLAYSVKSAVSNFRYEPLSRTVPRTNLSQIAVFRVEDNPKCLDPPQEFGRPPPAPIPPPFIVYPPGFACPGARETLQN